MDAATCTGTIEAKKARERTVNADVCMFEMKIERGGGPASKGKGNGSEGRGE